MEILVFKRDNQVIIRRPATRDENRMEVKLDMNEVSDLQSRLSEIMKDFHAR
jgi:hypothetical protein